MSPGPTRRRARIIGLFVAAALPASVAALVPARALAQQAGGALDRFDPAPVGDTFFSLPSADVAGRLRFAGSAVLSYAHDPLVLRQIPSGPEVKWVSDQAVLHLQLGVEVWKRVKLDLDVPALLVDGGASGEIDGQKVSAPSGAHIGDVRVEARGALVHQQGLVPAAGLSLSVWAPTGSASSFAGAGVARFQPGVILGSEHRHLVWSVSVGARFQPSTTNGVVGSQIVGGVGVAARFLGVTVGPELFYGASAGDKQRAAIFSGTSGGNAELLLGARYRVGPVGIGLAGGPGLGRGPGTPVYRLLAGLSGTLDAICPDAEDDGDPGAGTRPASSAPPAPVAAPPPLDSDGDGVPDAEDACPTVVGDATPGAYRRGCPPDRDRDGIPDADDACPDVPGVPSTDPTKNGCPVDSDGDGIPDDKDACPQEKGPPNQDPKLNGCPTGKVRIEGSQIVILQNINFDTAKATITPDSFTILEQVAALLQDHPEIARVAVDGHTDNRGGDAPNKALSEKRALAVVLWFTAHGVDARRLEARGFGMRRPIAANITTQGRAKNRRVEFLIRLRTDRGKAGWIDGPIDDGSPSVNDGGATGGQPAKPPVDGKAATPKP